MPPVTEKTKSKKKVKAKGEVKETAADIDDIFAGPSKPKVKEGKTADKKRSRKDDGKGEPMKKSKVEGKEKTKEKNKKAVTKSKGKSKAEPEEDSFDEFEGLSEDEPTGVLEVVDPSVAVRAAVEKTKAAAKSKARGKEVEADMAFRDSRGDGNRRKTEEGFFIFKEAELKIDPEAGGTPLCPFDCECCF